MGISWWVIALAFGVPSAGLFGVIFRWRWMIDRRRERIPISEKLLRPPGESLRRRIADLDEKLSETVLVIVLAPFAGIIAALTNANSHAKETSFGLWIAAVISISAFAFYARRLLAIVSERRNCLLGFHGERAVGEELNQLMLDGCRVFHDVPMEPYGNIDHVIVSPAGVIAVETKTRRKRPAPPGKRDHEVVFDGKALQFPHGSDTHGLEQARQQADRLRSWLTSATGESVRVTPMLALPGWYVTSRVNADTKVLNPGQIRRFVSGLGKPSLSPEQLQRVVHQLDQKCRDVEL